ncbi:hypothetical protein WJX73_001832 [Symbiochloris irregularis]|uniref:Uncharacterized protein n=1 Tax=Symbiochloris irregularis TaxID=706552 RepID=A0AAW1P0G6_9CHLO
MALVFVVRQKHRRCGRLLGLQRTNVHGLISGIVGLAGTPSVEFSLLSATSAQEPICRLRRSQQPHQGAGGQRLTSTSQEQQAEHNRPSASGLAASRCFWCNMHAAAWRSVVPSIAEARNGRQQPSDRGLTVNTIASATAAWSITLAALGAVCSLHNLLTCTLYCFQARFTVSLQPADLLRSRIDETANLAMRRQRQVTSLKSRLRNTEETLARINHDGSRTSSRSASPNMDEIKSWPGSRHTTPDKAAGAAATSGIVKDVLNKLEALSQPDKGQDASVRSGAQSKDSRPSTASDRNTSPMRAHQGIQSARCAPRQSSGNSKRHSRREKVVPVVDESLVKSWLSVIPESPEKPETPRVA